MASRSSGQICAVETLEKVVVFPARIDRAPLVIFWMYAHTEAFDVGIR